MNRKITSPWTRTLFALGLGALTLGGGASLAFARDTVTPDQAPQPTQQVQRPLPPAAPVAAGIDRRNLDILDRRQRREQVIALEDEAEMLAAQCGEFVGLQVAGLAA